MPNLEICCDSLHSALHAQAGGADRIELCENLAQGGVTPSMGKIKLTVQALDIPVFVLIRPRKADFLYTEEEFQIMVEDIHFAKTLGVKGIVSGILLADGTMDIPRMAKLVEAAHPLPFTCHRAFDMCREPLETIDALAGIGVKRILTSGQQPDAVAGRDDLERFAAHADNRLSIMACGDLLPENMDSVLSIPGIHEYHSAARRPVLSQMAFRGHTHMGDEAVEEEFRWQEVDPDLVSGMKKAITLANTGR